MGGDAIIPPTSTSEEDSSSLEQDFSQVPSQAPTFLRDNISMKVEDGTDNADSLMVFKEFDEVCSQFSPASLNFEARRRNSCYREVLQSYNELRIRSENLKETKSKILSYTPGAWIENVGGLQLADYDVPKTTSLILIGPKGSGKSSLVNKISKVFDEDKFASERAQVSYTSVVDGTHFLQEYMIPKGSMSFCLFDTRSLSDDSSENTETLKRWMTKGVCHGDPVVRSDFWSKEPIGFYDLFIIQSIPVCKLLLRDSDSASLRTGMKGKARWNIFLSREVRMVNSVVVVVNGISVLKSMDSNDESDLKYTRTIAAAFSCPYLSFKDDKPLVVVTHGDLLSLSDRARIRVYLGELLGIPPAKQIFDIPESSDPVTDLTIIDMLRFSLERADKNLPRKSWIMKKVRTLSPSACMLILITLGIVIISAYAHHAHIHHVHQGKAHRKAHKRSPKQEINWHAIRHLWLE